MCTSANPNIVAKVKDARQFIPQGGKTRTITTPQGKLLSRSKLALGGTTALITTTTSEAGLTQTTTTTGGGLTRSSTVTTDAQGRTVQQVDEDGVTTNYEYADFGRTVIEKDVAGDVLRTTRQYLDGQLKSVTGAAVVAEYHDHAVAADGRTTHTVHYGVETGGKYRRQVTDGAGLLLQEIEPPQDGGAVEKVTQHTYDMYGRRERTQVTGMAQVIFMYDSLSRAGGQRVVPGAGSTLSEDDPLTTWRVVHEPEADSTALWEVTQTWQAVDGNAEHDLHTERRVKIGTGQGRVSITISPDGTELTETTTVNRSTGTVTTTRSSNRASNTAVRVVVNGFLQSETGLTATGATEYTYDGLERVSTVTTPEGVVRKTLHDDTTDGVARQRVKEQQLKLAGGSAFITQAAYAYYPLGAAHEGRLHTLTNAEGATTIYTYDAAGRVLTQTGTASYPLRYDYDALGRLWKLHTYRGTSPDLEEDGDVTTWNYDPASGKLAGKRDAANKGVSYTYTAAGQLHTRTWQRGIVTTYGYDGAGRLTNIDYDDSTTPDVSYGYDRAGRRTSITDAAGTHVLTYAGTQPDTWTVAAGTGPWAGLSVDYGITAGRRTGRTTSQGGITLPSVSYTYAPANGELESITSADITETYRRSAATGWNEGLTYTQGGSTRLTSTRTPYTRGRLDTISWADAGNTVLSSHDYTLDEMNRRTHALRQDGSQWTYGYNLRGEVTSAAKEDATAVPEPGKQYTYGFDGLGNRTSSTVSSLADHEVVRSTGYTTNELNQYTEVSHPSPGWLVQRGSARTEATVSIDGEAPTLRFGQQWHDEKSVDNSAGAVRRVSEVTATRPDGGANNGPVAARQKGSRFIPPPVETITHDEDGNQTTNAQWTYTWDGENRLIAAEENTSVHLRPSGATPVKRQRLEFAYDSQGRRISKRVLLAEAGSTTFVLKQGITFLYDGWNMIAEIDTTQTQPRLLRSYEWGLDVSETMAGAGGVGGLLLERFHSATSSSAHAPCYDGNGNVVELVSFTSNAVLGRYEYGAFGEAISVEGGVVADANPVRFSTKYCDSETELFYYTHRYYDAFYGRWLSRDPIGERGGINLYGMVGNDLINQWDYLGQQQGQPQQQAVQGNKIQIGQAYQITYQGKHIGDVAVTKYDFLPTPTKIGMVVIFKTRLTDPNLRNVCFLRWRQRYSITDQKGNFLNWPQNGGNPANNMLDPQPNDDDKEWYWTNEGRKQHSPDGIAEDLGDGPGLFVSRLVNGVDKVTHQFKSELVKVNNLDQKDGGEVLLTITWGYWFGLAGQGQGTGGVTPPTMNPPPVPTPQPPK